jgi:hypothetical protein
MKRTSRINNIKKQSGVVLVPLLIAVGLIILFAGYFFFSSGKKEISKLFPNSGIKENTSENITVSQSPSSDLSTPSVAPLSNDNSWKTIESDLDETTLEKEDFSDL